MMEIRFSKYIPAAAIAAAMLTGCSLQTNPETVPVTSSDAKVRLSFYGNEDETVITDIKGYRFHDGILKEIIIPELTDEGTYTFGTAAFAGDLYLLANAGNIGGIESLSPGNTQEKDFISMTDRPEAMVSGGFAMCGKVRLGEFQGNTVDAVMTRSVARIDICGAEKGVRITEVKISGLADIGYVNPQDGISSPPGASFSGEPFLKEFNGAPLEGGKERLLYAVEQKSPGITAEIITESGGGRQKLTAVLPDILARNMVYTINVYGNGAEITSSLAGEDWESGNEADSGKIPGGLIDIGRSQLHDGIEINGTLDTVYVTHLANSFSLSVLAARGASVAVSGRIDGVEIRQDAPKSTDLEPVQDIYVTSRLRMPGIPEERMYIDIWEEGRITGRITLIFRQNPVKIEGAVRFGSDGVCDFGRYIDGELARISVPEGSMMLVEFAKDGPPWMKAEETARNPESSEGREYRLLGGWKPNDPEADGRVQEGKIVFCDMDGNNREEYTVRRLNWGLPVVKMGDTWWAKYNLRGNSRDFSAQITPDKDPASHDMVAGMLVSASDSVLLELMGDQYQGGNTDGLKLSTDGQVYYYNGFSSSAQNFGDIDPASMTPDGYRIPDYDDYAFFSANDNFNIGGTGTRTFRNISGKDVTVTVSERTASFLGLEYGTVAIYDFESEGNHWVLYGPGHQWNSDKGNVARMNILLATYGDSGKSWGMEGYASSDRPGQNWMKFTAHNIWKTRTIRCIKTPVEYIYE